MAVTATDPKVAVLAASRSLNPYPEKVTDEVFLASPFCDPRDLVQVKYEMVRRVRVDKVPVVRAARAFGYCRQAFYEIAAARLRKMYASLLRAATEHVDRLQIIVTDNDSPPIEGIHRALELSDTDRLVPMPPAEPDDTQPVDAPPEPEEEAGT
ncbi:hypothetical protein AB0O67_28935 [Streptomyces sp. NPDC086077]|uniref:hypothetical protein n=1 Tax=Streptomyces sp. NPDC086077 TaxID=3154862 RepID=UPI00343862AF